MAQVLEYVKIGLRWCLSNKSKFALALLSTLLFLFLLFPFDDLSDLVASQVSKATQNQVYVQFDHMDINILPMGLHLENLSVETRAFPAITVGEISVSPSISALIYQKPGGSLYAKGFLKGNVDISLSSGGKSENGVEKNKITIEAEKLSLKDLQELLNLPVPLRGNLDLKSTAVADFAFKEQPDVEVDLKVEKFEIPPSNVNTPMGPMNLPELKVSSLQLKGRLSAGRFQIEQGLIGKGADEITGTIKGGMSMQIQNLGGRIMPMPGSYSFDIDITVKKSFEDRAKLFLSFIEQHKTPVADGARFKFKLSASGPESVPNFGALQ